MKCLARLLRRRKGPPLLMPMDPLEERDLEELRQRRLKNLNRKDD